MTHELTKMYQLFAFALVELRRRGKKVSFVLNVTSEIRDFADEDHFCHQHLKLATKVGDLSSSKIDGKK